MPHRLRGNGNDTTVAIVGTSPECVRELVRLLRKAGLGATFVDSVDAVRADQHPIVLVSEGTGSLSQVLAPDLSGMSASVSGRAGGPDSPAWLRDGVALLRTSTLVELIERSQRRLPSRPQSRLRLLSRRQAEILQLVVEGYADRQIAERLVLSVRTVNRHVSDILHVLGVQTRRDLAFLGQRRPRTLGRSSGGNGGRARA